MATLNPLVDSTGVSHNAIRTVDLFRDWLYNVAEDDDNPRESTFVCQGNVRDAKYIVGCFQAFQSMAMTGRFNPQRKTEFSFRGPPDLYVISNNAIAVFCDFLRQPSASLLDGISLMNLPLKQTRRVLQALQTNLSIIEIQIDNLEHPSAGEWIGNLFHHKSNFSVIVFESCRFPLSGILLSGFGRQHAHLRKLSFCNCGIDDEGTRLIFQTLRRGQYPHLEHLDLMSNKHPSD